MRTTVRTELTTAELEAWIEKRAAESSADSNLHLWDLQAMRHLKAERDCLRLESEQWRESHDEQIRLNLLDKLYTRDE